MSLVLLCHCYLLDLLLCELKFPLDWDKLTDLMPIVLFDALCHVGVLFTCITGRYLLISTMDE